MEIRCAGCGRGYVLPGELVGPGGSRVRCPACGAVFTVGSPPAPAGPGAGPDAAREARRLLGSWLEPRREDVRAACVAGTLWSTYGPELAGLFDRLREACPEPAGAGHLGSAFRAALQELAGVSLVPG